MNQSKAFLQDIFDDMVERKLWPVAVILLLSLIAIPLVVAKPASKGGSPPPGAAATAPAASGAPSPLTAFEPVVSATEASAAAKGLRGRPKNPFLAKGIDFSSADEAGDAEPTSGLGDASVSSGATAEGAGEASPQTTTTTGSGSQGTQGSTKYYTYAVEVRFGEENDQQTRTLSPFRALPSTDNPVAVFMGVKRDGETAAFLVSSSATTTGDGDCEPTGSTCTFLFLKRGESQLIETVTNEGEIITYDLELVSVDAKPTNGPKKAGASRKARDSARASERRAARARTRHALRAFGRLPF